MEIDILNIMHKQVQYVEISKIKDNNTMMTSQKVAQPMAAVASYSTSHSEVRALDLYKTTRSKQLQTHLHCVCHCWKLAAGKPL